MAVDIPHFKLPFRWEASSLGGLAAGVCDQESVEEIGGCCEAVLRTVQGQRTTLPEFGRPQLEFNTAPESVKAALAAALLEWEPRVQSYITDAPDDSDEGVQVVRALIAPADDEEGDQS
jgi:phage baseplate assembly protein W